MINFTPQPGLFDLCVGDSRTPMPRWHEDITVCMFNFSDRPPFAAGSPVEENLAHFMQHDEQLRAAGELAD